MQKKHSSIRKRIFSLLLAAVMTLSCTTTAFATEEIVDTSSSTVEVSDSAQSEISDIADEEAADTGSAPFEEYHYVSDVKGDGVLPFEYHIIDCSDIEASDIELDVTHVPSYNSSRTKYNSSFAYDALTQDEQAIYDSIYTLAATIDSSTDHDAEYMSGTGYSGYFFPAMKISDSAIDANDLYRVYVALTNDNPQLFWLGHQYLSGSGSDGSVYFYFGLDSDDFISGDDRMATKELLYEEIESTLACAAEYGNEYSKEWYIHNYLCEKTDYVLDAEHAHNVTGLLLDGEAVCEAYAKSFQLYMNALNIDVLYVTGIGNGGNHAWNQVGLDNNGVTEWYNVDVTWDDNNDGYDFYYFNAVDSDGTDFDFTNGYTSGGQTANEHTPLSEGEREYIYDVYTCNSTTYSYANHSKNYKLASTDPVAKIGTTEYKSLGAAIEASTSGQTITLLADTTYIGTAMPEHELTIDCAGYCIEFASGMDLAADLTIKNHSGYNFEQLYANGNPIYTLNYIYLNDNTLSFSGAMTNYIPVLISGYVLNEDETESYESGIVQIDLDDEYCCNLIKAVGIEGLTIAENEQVNIHCGFDADDVVLGNGTVLSIDHGYGEMADLSIADDAWLEITSNDPDPFFCIYDTITADVVNVKAANMEVGLASVVTRLKYSVELFNFVYSTTSGETDYKVTRMVNGDNIYLYMPYETDDFTISDGTNEAKRCTFPEAVEWIDEQNNSSKDYTITYTGNYTKLIVNNDLVFGNANSITFDGININLTGDITLNTDITFDYGGAFWGVIYGNDHTITFADNDTTSGFCGAYAENLNVVVLNSSVSFLDDSKSGNDIQLNTLTLNGDADIGYSAVDKLTVDKLVISDINNSIIFNSGKAEIGDIICEGSCAFNIKDGDVLTVNGATFDGNPIELYSETPKSGQKLITVSEDISGFFITYVQNANGDTYSVAYREGTLVLDIPVFRIDDGSVYSQWSDVLAYINENGSATEEFTILLLNDVTLDSFTLPSASKAKTLTILDEPYGSRTIYLNAAKLSVPTTVYFEGPSFIAPETDVTVANGKEFAGTNHVQLKSATGTATSSLAGATAEIDSIKTFGAIDIYKLTVNETMSGVTNFEGELVLKNSTSPVTITSITNNSKISYQTGDTLPKVTVSNIADGKTLTINVNDGAALANQTTVLYCTSDISGQVSIENTAENGKALSPIYYASTKSIKAEDASAVTVKITDANGSTTTRNFPTIELALAAVKDNTCDYTITLNQEYTLSKLTLPKTAKSITFAGEDITFTGKTLNIPVDITFECDLIANDAAVKITAKKAVFQNLLAKDITGTKTTELITSYAAIQAQNIKTFGKLSGTFVVFGSATGITEIGNGVIAMYSPTGNADIAKITGDATIAYCTGDILPKVTVTDIADGASLIIDVNERADLASGTTVLYTKGKDLSEHITIGNQTPEGKALKAYYYSKAIKAEWPDAVTLSYDGNNTNYPNLDKVFEAINANNDSTMDYTITLNTPVTMSKLTLPKYANSITFAGEALTFTGKTLKLTLNTYFNCELIAENTALTTTKNLGLKNAALKSIAGAKTSVLTVTGTVNTPSVKTFAEIDASAGELVISGTASGITSFIGNITASNVKSNITITSAGTSNIKLVADDLGTVGKVTVNGAADNAAITVTAVDANGDTITLASGTPLLYCSSDISSSVTITNQTSGGKDLSASYYAKKKAIYAEYANAVAVSYSTANGDVNENYSSFEKAFAAIPVSAEGININLNCDVVAESFTVPKFVNGLSINGLVNTVTLKNISAISLAVPATFNDVTINSTKSFKISTTNSLTLSSFASSTLSAITGKATGTLSYNGENDVNYTVSGFGTLDLMSGPVLNISKAFTIKNVVADNSAILGIKSGANVKLTTVNSDGISSDELIIKYYDGATTPVSISGVITGNILFTHETSFTDGQQLLTAAKADLAALSFEPEALPDNRDYILTAKSGKIYLKAIAFEVSDDTDNYSYADWADFVAMVNAKNNAEAVYTVTLTGDHNVGAALTMPRAGTYSKIVICSADENMPSTLTFTGAVKLTGELELNSLNFWGANAKGALAAYTITAGKYSLTASNIDFGNGSITGSAGSVITLDNCQLGGKLTAVDAVLCDTSVTGAVKTTKILTIDGFAEFGNTVNAFGLANNGDCTIVLTKGKLLTVGKGGTGEGTIYISLGSTEITAKTKLGTIIKGYYSDNFVGDGFELAVDSNVINAYPI